MGKSLTVLINKGFPDNKYQVVDFTFKEAKHTTSC